MKKKMLSLLGLVLSAIMLGSSFLSYIESNKGPGLSASPCDGDEKGTPECEKIQEQLAQIDAALEDATRSPEAMGAIVESIAKNGIAYARTLEDPEMAGRYYFIFVGHYLDALAAQTKTSEVFNQLENAVAEPNYKKGVAYADLLKWSAQLQEQRGNLDIALNRYMRAEQIYRRERDVAMYGLKNDLGNLYLALEDNPTAKNLFSEAASAAQGELDRIQARINNSKGKSNEDIQELKDLKAHYVDLIVSASSNLAIASADEEAKAEGAEFDVAKNHLTKALGFVDSLEDERKFKFELDRAHVSLAMKNADDLLGCLATARAYIPEKFSQADSIVAAGVYKDLPIGLSGYYYLLGGYYKLTANAPLAITYLGRAYTLARVDNDFRTQLLSCRALTIVESNNQHAVDLESLLQRQSKFRVNFNEANAHFQREAALEKEAEESIGRQLLDKPWFILFPIGLLVLFASVIDFKDAWFSRPPLPTLNGGKEKLVLFIHGLGGNNHTWRDFHRILSEDKELLREYSFAFYDFPTSLTNWTYKFWKPVLNIQELSEGLETEIKTRFKQDKDIVQDEDSVKYKDIVLVCHSMGGLVARHYLLEEVKKKNPLKVRQLLLYAVPNNGSHLANFGFRLTFRHRQIAQLRPRSEFIKQLNRDWETFNLFKKVRTHFVVASQDSIVDETSAKGYWREGNISVDNFKDHFSLVKPKDGQDLSYLILRKFLREGGISPSVFSSALSEPLEKREFDSYLCALQLLAEKSKDKDGLSLLLKINHAALDEKQKKQACDKIIAALQGSVGRKISLRDILKITDDKVNEG